MIFRKLAPVTHTIPDGSRNCFGGFSDPINSFKPFPGHFEQLFEKSIFWVSDVSGPGPTGSHHFPKAVFLNVQARYLKTDLKTRLIDVEITLLKPNHLPTHRFSTCENSATFDFGRISTILADTHIVLASFSNV